MRPSRGMGDINPSKMPGKKTITRKDDPNKVAMYKRGGKVKKFDEGGETLAEKARQQIAEYQNSGADNSMQSDFTPVINGGGAGDKYGVGMGGRASLQKRLSDNATIGAYLEGGAYKPKEGKAQGKLTGAGANLEYRWKEGGKVNAAGNYTKPGLRKKIVSQVKAAATQGTKAGQWSARKAQLVAKKYKASGGGYKD